MPLSYITYQPSYNDTLSAYRPIEFVVQGAANQTVYCDVYIGGLYYRTLMSNFYDTAYGPGYYRFDVQEVAREALTTMIIPVNLYGHMTWSNGPNIISVQCGFRGSTIGAYGDIVPSGTAPVQGTLGVPAVGGSAEVWSTVVQAFNGAQQHEMHPTLLIALQLGKATHTQSAAQYNGGFGLYPLSRATQYRVTMGDRGHYSGYIKDQGYLGTPIQNTRLLMYAEVQGANSSAWQVFNLNYSMAINHVQCFAIPTGPLAIQTISATPGALVWQRIINYFIVMQVVGGAYANQIIFQTPTYAVDRGKNQRRVRLWFRNYFGGMDQINFRVFEEEASAKSDRAESPLPPGAGSPGLIYKKAVRGLIRTNVRATSSLTLSDRFDEIDLLQLEQLLSSSLVYQELSRGEIDNYGGGDLKPVIIEDGSITKVKATERYKYDVTIKLTMGNEKIIPSTNPYFK